jgi:hypothetical protein
MTKDEKQQILDAAKTFFRTRIAPNHNRNTEKLKDISEFNVNPFLNKYLAQFAFGDSSPESMAKALIYPRVLGTSITTSFGTNMQYFCNDVLAAFASTTSGIDIEFVDAEDGIRKYCQVKAGPNTINKDDVPVIKDHFRGVINLARTNGMRIASADCVVGVLYGSSSELSGHYKSIDEDYPVIVGKDFWYHLTGDQTFYDDLINAFAEVADEMDSSTLLQETITALAAQINQDN